MMQAIGKNAALGAVSGAIKSSGVGLAILAGNFLTGNQLIPARAGYIIPMISIVAIEAIGGAGARAVNAFREFQDEAVEMPPLHGIAIGAIAGAGARTENTFRAY